MGKQSTPLSFYNPWPFFLLEANHRLDAFLWKLNAFIWVCLVNQRAPRKATSSLIWLSDNRREIPHSNIINQLRAVQSSFHIRPSTACIHCKHFAAILGHTLYFDCRKNTVIKSHLNCSIQCEPFQRFILLLSPSLNTWVQSGPLHAAPSSPASAHHRHLGWSSWPKAKLNPIYELSLPIHLTAIPSFCTYWYVSIPLFNFGPRAIIIHMQIVSCNKTRIQESKNKSPPANNCRVSTCHLSFDGSLVLSYIISSSLRDSLLS